MGFEHGWGTEFEDGIFYNWAALEALNNRKAMINVAAETTHVDDGVGTVIAALEELGALDDTLVIYLSDQGSSYGQNGIWGNSSWAIPGTAYDSNMQVPLILRTIYLGLKDQRDKHRWWARITAPVWLYVSVTGVVVYVMLYHL